MSRPRFLSTALFRPLLAVLLLAGCGTRPGGRAADSYPHYAGRVAPVDKAGLRYGDGDTFTSSGLVIRVLGIDTPETANPHHGFDEGQPYGRQAAEAARQLLSRAATVEYLPSGRDRYGRVLAHVFVDGELFGVKMIEAGLAYETVSFYGDNGFPDLAEELLRAAEKAGRPPFMEPRLWRREHRADR